MIAPHTPGPPHAGHIDLTTLRGAAAEVLTAATVNVPVARRTVAALSRPLLPDLRSEEWVQQTASQLTEIAARIETSTAS